MKLDMTKLEPLLGTVVNELGAASNAALVIIGDKLGLFRALADGSDMTLGRTRARRPARTSATCASGSPSQAASGFVGYDAASRTFLDVAGAGRGVRRRGQPGLYDRRLSSRLTAVYADEPKLGEAFRTGRGLGWGDHCNCLFCGVERFFRPGYKAHLVADWLPALDGVVDKLERGAKVADVGCGHGVFDHAHGRGVPELRVRRHRLPRGVDRPCEEARQRPAQRPLRDGACAGLCRLGLRPRHHVRRPARHGRPGRGDRAYPQVASSRMAR